jgi:GNAT superfamily N-acetyltransferase
MGELTALESLLDGLDAPARVLLLAPEDARDLLETYYSVDNWAQMLRMRVTADEFTTPMVTKGTSPSPLTRADATAMSHLLERAATHDDRPLDDIAFADDMVEAGFYMGVWEDNQLVAMAGTHLVAPQASIAALGNVVVAPEARRQGLGLAVSAHVTGSLLQAGYETVILNVHRSNAPAIRLYEQLGYSVRCSFIEAAATRYP